MNTKDIIKSGTYFPAVFNDFFKPWNEWFDNGSGLTGNLLNVPAVNISEVDDTYKVSLAVPGLKKEDFKINIEGNILNISTEKREEKEEKGEKFTRKEYNYSAFSRSFTLPDGVVTDKIEATYKDGELQLLLPKKEVSKKVETKKIAIK